MKTTLHKTFVQLDKKGGDESSLTITIEAGIDRTEHTAEFSQLVSVVAYNHKTGIYTDLTHIFFNCFHDQAEAIIKDVDWWEVYRETKEYVAA